jgi:hypothetical protein
MALFCQWKQLSATLLHRTYVTNGFSHFDPRTANIERALRDLDPLLQVYAEIPGSSQMARLSSLRVILQKGAKLALMLFAQPCFWQFDWSYSSPLVPLVKVCDDGFDQNLKNTGPEARKDGKSKETVRCSCLNGYGGEMASGLDIVVWPALLRVMDGEGASIPSEERALTKKTTLSDIKSTMQIHSSQAYFNIRVLDS